MHKIWIIVGPNPIALRSIIIYFVRGYWITIHIIVFYWSLIVMLIEA